MWVSASQKIPLSVLAQNLHKGLAREISYEIGKGRGKEGPEQSRERSRTDQLTEQSSQGKPIVKRRKVTARTCGQHERMSQHFS